MVVECEGCVAEGAGRCVCVSSSFRGIVYAHASITCDCVVRVGLHSQHMAHTLHLERWPIILFFHSSNLFKLTFQKVISRKRCGSFLWKQLRYPLRNLGNYYPRKDHVIPFYHPLTSLAICINLLARIACLVVCALSLFSSDIQQCWHLMRNWLLSGRICSGQMYSYRNCHIPDFSCGIEVLQVAWEYMSHTP